LTDFVVQLRRDPSPLLFPLRHYSPEELGLVPPPPLPLGDVKEDQNGSTDVSCSVFDGRITVFKKYFGFILSKAYSLIY
jgi:hypothetical protein